ncbi:MAG: VacJ family lipoprotein [Proteobacteria bacterium]|nr:VacJ family lipoprotein [Pseudomonadota bacterium]
MIGRQLYRLSKYLLIVGLLLVATGCATTQTADGEINEDPIEPTNRVFFNINETLDKHFLKPVAEGYVAVTPVPVRTSITNFFDNLTYLNVILNDFLQGKFSQGMDDTFRFLFNSTLGIGGLFDVATPMGLPENEEDFGQTLAVWGVDKGSYLYLPLFGPNTVRDTTDFVPSTLLNPFFYITSTVLLPVSALNAINTRANLLEASNIRDEAAIDPYAFTREAHLQQREFLIYDGNPPVTGYDDIFLEAEDEESGVLIIE